MYLGVLTIIKDLYRHILTVRMRSYMDITKICCSYVDILHSFECNKFLDIIYRPNSIHLVQYFGD
jgi:hypothetical protein